MGNDCKIYTFNFNTDNLAFLRNAVTEKENVSLNKTRFSREYNQHYFVWDQLCAIMDRLDDTVDYINMLQIGKCRSKRSAFDFYEFINNAFIVIQCIKTIAQIFNVDNQKIRKIENSQEVFGDVLDVGGTDGLFFEYIRSLCAVHPVETNRKKYPYITKRNSVLHCCPFVVWDGVFSHFRDDNRDLSAHVYESKENEHTLSIPLYIKQFENYINKWINFIPEVIKSIKDYNEEVYNAFRQQKLRGKESFKNYVEYLEYLKEVHSERYGDMHDYIYDQYIKVFSTKISNPRNLEKVNKYKNAIKYSLNFLFKSLQNMQEFGFDNTGIKEDEQSEGGLFYMLAYPNYNNEELGQYSYNLSKLGYLEDDHYWCDDQNYARFLLEEIKDIINKYVVFTNKESNDETVVLVYTALYLSSLCSRCTLNKNIPNSKKYRIKLLSKTKIKWLYRRPRYKKVKAQDLIARFLNNDGSIDEVKFEDL